MNTATINTLSPDFVRLGNGECYKERFSCEGSAAVRDKAAWFIRRIQLSDWPERSLNPRKEAITFELRFHDEYMTRTAKMLAEAQFRSLFSFSEQPFVDLMIPFNV